MKTESSLVIPVLHDIKRKIVAWEFPPNYQLVEEELCKIYKVSRSPIRQALTHLEAENLVEKIPRRGFFVRQLRLKDIDDLYELRFAIELQVAKGLVQKGIHEDVYNKLVVAWTDLDESQNKTNSELAQMDEDFHTELAKAYDNSLILSQIKSINERIFIFRELDFNHKGRLVGTKKEHLEILKLLMSKDIKKLETLLQKNLYSGLANVENAVIQLVAKSYVSKI